MDMVVTSPEKISLVSRQKVIKIWKSHGFYWGGDWSGKKDTMHFSYTEKPDDGKEIHG